MAMDEVHAMFKAAKHGIGKLIGQGCYSLSSAKAAVDLYGHLDKAQTLVEGPALSQMELIRGAPAVIESEDGHHAGSSPRRPCNGANASTAQQRGTLAAYRRIGPDQGPFPGKRAG